VSEMLQSQYYCNFSISQHKLLPNINQCKFSCSLFTTCRDTIQVRYRKGPLSQKSAGHMQNSKTKTNTNPRPDPNRYRRRCPDPNARIQKFIHYMAIATFAIAALCDSGQSPLQDLQLIYRKFMGSSNSKDKPASI